MLTVRQQQQDVRVNAAVDKIQEAINLLPKESQSSLTEVIKKVSEVISFSS